jgi:hypothetical protein
MNAPLITAPGFYPQITCDQYFAEPCPAPALTNTGVKMLNTSAPAKYAYQMLGIGQEEADSVEWAQSTAAQYRGKLVHRLALDKGDDYEISPFPEFRSDEAKEWKQTVECAGLIPVKQVDFDAAVQMAGIVRERIAEACQGRPYQTEVVIAWQEMMSNGPVWCRAMLDVWCPDLLLGLDVKNWADASDAGLQRSFANGAATQDVWYRRGIEKLTAEPGRARFRFLVVEPDPPFLSRTATATEAFRHGAALEVSRALAVFADCLSRNEWPGYDDTKVDPPGWLVSRWSAGDFMDLAA